MQNGHWTRSVLASAERCCGYAKTNLTRVPLQISAKRDFMLSSYPVDHSGCDSPSIGHTNRLDWSLSIFPSRD